MMKILYKTNPTTKRTKYYKLELSINLFGNYILERTYGSCSNKTPTGKKMTEYINEENALFEFNKIIKAKLKKGYQYQN